MHSAQVILQKYWKHKTFRDPQEEIINAVLNKQNTIALLPTGAGKSVCFQIPALLNDGVCLVISPLISLMEDQVNGLQQKGIKAIAITSKYNSNEIIQAFDNLRFGNYKFIYLSPEKLQSEFIQEKLSQLNVNLIAIDEAHCISQWGHDFRPAYLKIALLHNIYPKANFIALTASATDLVIKDIAKYLSLKNIQIFKKSFYRNNINIEFVKTDNVFEKLKQFLVKVKEPVIVYAGTRKRTIQIANFLNHHGFKSAYYHGGLTHKAKSNVLYEWSTEIKPIVVATNAFGMGIDKANVRLVVHLNIPNSIENYMQEIGRAGRDGKQSFAYLIYNDSIIFESETFLSKGMADTAFCKTIYSKLHENYQISKGEFNALTHTFNLQDFCSKYKLPILKAYSALQCFENENIITLQQNANKRSRLKVLVSNRYLIDYENRNPKLETLLKVILRSYGGAFEQYIAINENALAKKMNTTKANIVQLLQRLNTDKVITYIKASSNSDIKFLVPREDEFVIHSISKNIENRNHTKKTKSKAIIKLIQNNKKCRNIQLLSYFGETNLKKCDSCDVCLAEKKRNTSIPFNDIANNILSLFIDNSSLEFDEILNQIPADRKNILKTLELLIEKNSIRLTSQNKLEKVKHG
ncbi:MAG: RecQ family ATP-dependent DNA helicase [Flavobacteriaceae bacterium]|nr:RecQ family ATP-dependent DNA helicase [Flavobacteriaceae bacterium]